MSIPQIFNFDNHAVRTIEKDGDVWFVAADVTDVLGYKNGRDAIAKHCKASEAGVAFYDGSQNRDMTIIPERDLYRLVMKSKLPAAEKFENWVVSEVLPSIRKTGTYTPAATPELQIANAILLAGRMIEEQKAQIEQRDKLIAITAPKAAALDKLSLADGSLCMTDAAKTLGIQPQKTLIPYLRANKWIYNRTGCAHPVAYQDKLQQMLLEHKTTTVNRTDGSEKITEQVRITAKGLTKLAQIFGQPETQEA